MMYFYRLYIRPSYMADSKHWAFLHLSFHIYKLLIKNTTFLKR